MGISPIRVFCYIGRASMKKQILRGIVRDFILLALLFFTVSFFIAAAKNLLYRSTSSSPVRISVITEELDTIYNGRLKIGDAIYDTLTKVQLGMIEEISVMPCANGTRYVLVFTSKCEPRGNALRTSDLWFTYKRL